MNTISKEILKASKKLNIQSRSLAKDESLSIINSVVEKFQPLHMTGHLSIGESAKTLPLKKFEFNYSKLLPKEPGFVFFGQKSSFTKDEVIEVKEVDRVCDIMWNSFGIEYFLTNQKIDYLIAVNWYVIEYKGSEELFLKILNPNCSNEEE